MKKTTSSEEICQYCFGAKELTRDGRLPVPCPLCNGGKLEDAQLRKANKKLKLYTNIIYESKP
jgi:hypothetical protein